MLGIFRGAGHEDFVCRGEEIMKTDRSGFTLIELLVAIGILGIISLAVAPEIMNTLEVRDLENSARKIQTDLERAKQQAVRTKLNHRVRFDNSNTMWKYFIERETTPGNWEEMPGHVASYISGKYNVTLNLPPSDLSVVFSSLGFVDNFDINNNTIIVQSEKLKRLHQQDERGLIVFRGGSIRYTKSDSGG